MYNAILTKPNFYSFFL